jgi:hypothetical protein
MMTYAEDRVLVGVINRKRDLEIALKQQWYRIPEAQMKRGIQAEYLGFFLSRAFGEKNGSIQYFARITGYELDFRRFLLPNEPNHPKADQLYYKITFDPLIEKRPPITNDTRRTITFIYTTWDRFSHARVIGDLYSKADFFVDRIYHALRSAGMRPLRFWEAEAKQHPFAPGIRIETVNGPIYASAARTEEAIYLDWTYTQEEILEAFRQELERRGGLVDINVPLEPD